MSVLKDIGNPQKFDNIVVLMDKFWIHFFLIWRSYNHWTGKLALGNISFEISENIEEQIENGTLRHTEQIRQSFPCAHPVPVCLCGFITLLILNFLVTWRWVVSFTHRPLHSLGNRLRWTSNGRLGEPWRRVWPFGEKKIWPYRKGTPFSRFSAPARSEQNILQHII